MITFEDLLYLNMIIIYIILRTPHRSYCLPTIHHSYAAVDVASTLAKSKNITYLPSQQGDGGGRGGGSNVLMKVDAK